MLLKQRSYDCYWFLLLLNLLLYLLIWVLRVCLQNLNSLLTDSSPNPSFHILVALIVMTRDHTGMDKVFIYLMCCSPRGTHLVLVLITYGHQIFWGCAFFGGWLFAHIVPGSHTYWFVILRPILFIAFTVGCCGVHTALIGSHILGHKAYTHLTQMYQRW